MHTQQNLRLNFQVNQADMIEHASDHLNGEDSEYRTFSTVIPSCINIIQHCSDSTSLEFAKIQSYSTASIWWIFFFFFANGFGGDKLN
jgi:hypothetical protein